ncbi:MAG: hypothetical protein OHK0039_34080 [Bacteroidia bacterium]
MHDQHSVRIPVEIQHNIILVPLRINGSFEMNFILDTGVKTTILTEPLIADFLAFDTLTTVKVRGLGEGEPIIAALASNVSISMPGIEGYGQNMLVLPEGLISYSSMFGKPVYGIIGYEVFGRFVVEIDYIHKYIRLHDPVYYKPRRNWEEIPLEIRRAKPYVRATVHTEDGRVIEQQWLVDTGASAALSMFTHDMQPPSQAIEAFLGQGLNGNVYGKLGRSPRFELGSYAFEQVITGFPDMTSLALLPGEEGWYGNLGSEIISRFHVTFDYFRQAMYIKKNSHYKNDFEYNVSGIELLTMGENFENFVISYVRPNSPAARAGLQVNDEVLALNGLSVNGLEIDEVYGNLFKRSGRTVYLKIKRGNRVIKTRFELVTEI